MGKKTSSSKNSPKKKITVRHDDETAGQGEPVAKSGRKKSAAPSVDTPVYPDVKKDIVEAAKAEPAAASTDAGPAKEETAAEPLKTEEPAAPAGEPTAPLVDGAPDVAEPAVTEPDVAAADKTPKTVTIKIIHDDEEQGSAQTDDSSTTTENEEKLAQDDIEMDASPPEGSDTPDATGKEAAPLAPAETPEESPKETPKVIPLAVPDETPEETPEVKPADKPIEELPEGDVPAGAAAADIAAVGEAEEGQSAGESPTVEAEDAGGTDESTEPAEPNPQDSESATPDENLVEGDVPAAEIDKEQTIEEAQAASDLDKDDLDDDHTSAAIDDLARKNTNLDLDAEPYEPKAPVSAPKRSIFSRLKGFFAAWWGNPIARWVTIFAVPILLIASVLYPTTRYYFLNLFGANAGASVIVLDQSTQQPLKNVQVSIDTQTATTDVFGKVSFENLPLGKTSLTIAKPGFAEYNAAPTLGWGSNPLNKVSIKPVGARYTFMVKDWLSGKPVAKAEATSGEASAVSDAKGRLVITFAKVTDSEMEVTIKAASYREEVVKVKPSDKAEHPLPMVPSRKHLFISKRSGNYDVYKIDADGKNESKLVPGNGHERDDMVLVAHPAANVAAMVSTRDNQRNKDGFLLSSLYLIDEDTGKISRLTLSERVLIVDWIGDRLIYVTVTDGTSAGNPKRTKLVSYDKGSGESKELATANYFNDVLVAKGFVYYAPSSAAVPADQAKLFRINADGSNKTVILNKEAWNLFRTDYDKLNISVQQDWFAYKLGDSSTSDADGPPAQLKTRIYRESPDGKLAVRADTKDGKGVLILTDTGKNTEKVIQTKTGLQNPVSWLNGKYVVFRVSDGKEHADYVINVEGGEAKKIIDVSNTGGVDAWYYY